MSIRPDPRPDPRPDLRPDLRPDPLRRLFVPCLFAPSLFVFSLLGSPIALGRDTASPASPYGKIPVSADGIGKTYMGREITRVMGWQGASWLERPERENEERPDLLLDALALKPGMVIADIGAGTGYHARRMAAQVGPTGRVHAVDAQAEMIAILRRSIERQGLSAIVPGLATPTDVGLPPGTIDLAIMVDVYHEFEFPEEMLASIVRAMKPGGRVVFVEYRAEDPRVPIRRLHKMTEAQVRLEAARHPLVYERSIPGLPWQHAIVFRRR